MAQIDNSTWKFGDVNNYGGTINQGGTHTHNAPPADRPTPEEEREAILGDRSRNVFVVYGRDQQVRREVFEFLRRLDLRPLEWESLVHATGEGSPFVGRVVGDAPSLARAAVVLLTPDDVTMLHPQLAGTFEDSHELRPSLQPRPNVLLELGMVLALYPENTIILEFGEVRRIGDLAGRHMIRFNEAASLPGALRKTAARLESAGCPVDDSGTDWLDIRPFARMEAYRRQPREFWQ
jgi:predicted nucleotide-binding protein